MKQAFDSNRTLIGGDGKVVWIRAVVETSIRGDINQTKYEREKSFMGEIAP